MLTIAGVGPGNPKYLTYEVKDRILKADNILAFDRVAKSLETIRKDIIKVNKVDEVLKYLNRNEEVLLLASGDPTFFGIVEYIQKKEIIIKEVLPGLSSFQYMLAKLQKPWQGVAFLSLHGRANSLEKVKDNRLNIILIDKGNLPNKISKELYRLGIRGKIYTGYNLSYDDEKIIIKNIGEEIEHISSLAVVVVENEMD